MEIQKNRTAALIDLATDLLVLLATLEGQMVEVTEQMAALKQGGLIYATGYWRKDRNKQPTYFYLLYPHKKGERRRRDYIGSDPRRIDEALAGIVRAHDYDNLAARTLAFTRCLQHVAEALHDARRSMVHVTGG